VIKINFIFPRNFDFKSKLFGLVDYFTLFIDIIWFTFIFCLLNTFFKNVNIKIFLSISLCFPILILSITGLSNENIFFVLTFLFKYFLRPSLYLYNK